MQLHRREEMECIHTEGITAQQKASISFLLLEATNTNTAVLIKYLLLPNEKKKIEKGILPVIGSKPEFEV